MDVLRLRTFLVCFSVTVSVVYTFIPITVCPLRYSIFARKCKYYGKEEHHTTFLFLFLHVPLETPLTLHVFCPVSLLIFLGPLPSFGVNSHDHDRRHFFAASCSDRFKTSLLR